MRNRKLYNEIIEKIAYNVKKSLLERDLDAEGNWEFDEEIGGSGEDPHSTWEGWFDLNTNIVYPIDEDPGPIDPKKDEWKGLHKFIRIEAEPNDYNSYTIPATYDSPAEGETNIYSYAISWDDIIYKTTEYDGIYYFEGDESNELFKGLTDAQEKIISDWLDKNVTIEYWNFY